MAEALDVLCILLLGGWAYVAARRWGRDGVAWFLVSAAAFFAFGMAASQMVFPRLLARGAFPALGSESLLDKTFSEEASDADTPEAARQKALQERQKAWQTASGFLVGVPASIVVNLLLTFNLIPVAAPRMSRR